MATILSAPSATQQIYVDIAIPERVTTSWEQADAAAESAILKAGIVSIISGAILLGSISWWLWYGLQHYQNCL